MTNELDTPEEFAENLAGSCAIENQCFDSEGVRPTAETVELIMRHDEALYGKTLASLVEQRGVTARCGACRGLGTQLYGSTATWRAGIGRAEMTIDVCDCCWGSGDRKNLWPSHREFWEMRRLIGKS